MGTCKGFFTVGLDANGLLQARFRQRLLQTESVDATTGPMATCHVALSSASWAVLLRTTTQLLHGTSTEYGPVSAGQPVIFHLPGIGTGLDGHADEAAEERMEAPHAPENSSARALAEVTGGDDETNDSGADQGVKMPAAKQGRTLKSARKSIAEFKERLVAGQVEQEPDQATEETEGDIDRNRPAASRAASQEGVRDGQGGAAHGAVPTPKKDMPAPSRASRRLEARR